ncbi:MAG: hypothetical protein GXZ11_03370, partial [Tissierellia bacterium]|nr:hypothetical protein [Tissierellia bacterium]
MNKQRFFVEKQAGHNREAFNLFNEIEKFLNIHPTEVRIISVYDIYGVSEDNAKRIYDEILFESMVDISEPKWNEEYHSYRYEAVKGQYDQRGDATSHMASLLIGDEVVITSSRIVLIKGIDEKELLDIKKYHLNPVEYTEIDLDQWTYSLDSEDKEPISVVEGFIDGNKTVLETLSSELGLGLDMEDLLFIQSYFKKEDRDPTVTELKMLET